MIFGANTYRAFAKMLASSSEESDEHALPTRPASADLVLAGNSFEQRVGDLQVSGFVFDMSKIYEDAVCVALREAIKPYGGRSTLQHRMHLDVARDVAMRPDFVWLSNDVPAAVVDAKYKAEKPSGFPEADHYQLLAYCTVRGLSEGARRRAARIRNAQPARPDGWPQSLRCPEHD